MRGAADFPEEEMLAPVTCEVCRRDFPPKGRQTTVCSPSCAGERGAAARVYRKPKPPAKSTRPRAKESRR